MQLLFFTRSFVHIEKLHNFKEKDKLVYN